MKSIRQLKLCVLLLLLIILIGVTGYMTIEHWGFLDALYMTVTTFTTVGYSEVHKVSDLGRMFTIFFIIIGVMYFLYIAGVIVQFMVEGQIRTILGRRSLDKKIDRLKVQFFINLLWQFPPTPHRSAYEISRSADLRPASAH